MPQTMDITPTRVITMMDRPSISVDTITSPAVSKTGKPRLQAGLFFIQGGRPKQSPVAVVLFRYLEQGRLVSLANVRFLLPDQPADATHCRLASSGFILAHCPKIVLGVLKVILRRDPIPG
jgi:hypothetical protein